MKQNWKIYKYKSIVKKSLLIIFGLLTIFTNFNNNYYINNTSNLRNYEINPIKVAFYIPNMVYGGRERVISLLLKYLSNEKNFMFYLITQSGIEKGEYSIPKTTKRITLFNQKSSIFKVLNKEKVDIIIYNSYDIKEIKKFTKLKKTKVIFFNHSSYFLWIFLNLYHLEQTVYEVYKQCKYVVSLIPLENDYLFKNWGINSIFINNPVTYEYNLIIPSDLSKKNIIMIGRGDDFTKNFKLGIKAMKYIIKEIPKCQMKIISSTNKNLEELITNLSLGNNIEITGFQNNPEYYFKNCGLHIFTSICDTYPMVLSEAKIFGIPTIICGLDYLALAKKGTVIIFDDNPKVIAKESIKILTDDKYRKKLGKEARESMKNISNDLISKQWIKLLLSVNDGIEADAFSQLFKDKNDNSMSEKEANKILNNQLRLLKKLKPELNQITLEKLKSYSLK